MYATNFMAVSVSQSSRCRRPGVCALLGDHATTRIRYWYSHSSIPRHTVASPSKHTRTPNRNRKFTWNRCARERVASSKSQQDYSRPPPFADANLRGTLRHSPRTSLCPIRTIIISNSNMPFWPACIMCVPIVRQATAIMSLWFSLTPPPIVFNDRIHMDDVTCVLLGGRWSVLRL